MSSDICPVVNPDLDELRKLMINKDEVLVNLIQQDRRNQLFEGIVTSLVQKYCPYKEVSLYRLDKTNGIIDFLFSPTSCIYQVFIRDIDFLQQNQPIIVIGEDNDGANTPRLIKFDRSKVKLLITAEDEDNNGQIKIKISLTLNNFESDSYLLTPDYQGQLLGQPFNLYNDEFKIVTLDQLENIRSGWNTIPWLWRWFAKEYTGSPGGKRFGIDFPSELQEAANQWLIDVADKAIHWRQIYNQKDYFTDDTALRTYYERNPEYRGWVRKDDIELSIKFFNQFCPNDEVNILKPLNELLTLMTD